MTTETQTIEQTPSSSSSEGLSPAEAAYFSSRGEDVSGLDDVAQSAQRAAEAPASKEPTAANDDEDQVDGEITIDDNGQARDQKGRYVPHAALHKEREKGKQTRAELDTLRDKYVRAEERLAILNELITPPGKAPDGKTDAAAADDEAIPDPEQDVFGAVKALQKQNAKLAEQLKSQEETRKQRESGESLKQSYISDAQRFVSTTPDFKDAYKHLFEGMQAELKMLGVSDEAQRNSQIATREREFVQAALAAKQSPAEMIYQLAKMRGFAPKAAAPSAERADQRGAEKIENIRRGQQAVVSLSKAGGTGSEGLTMEALANMSEAEFARVSRQLGKSKMRSLMGG